MAAYELLYFVQANWNPKSRLEFVKDVIDLLASESKAIVGDPVQPPSAIK